MSWIGVTQSGCSNSGRDSVPLREKNFLVDNWRKLMSSEVQKGCLFIILSHSAESLNQERMG